MNYLEKEQLLTRLRAEASALTREELVEDYAQVCVEREATVANLRSALVIAEQELLKLRRSQIDAVQAMLSRLEARQ